MDNKLTINQKEEKGYITLPYNQDEFKEFIIGLLGRPQSISKKIGGSFTITSKDIENVYCLINQRILQQNDAKFVSFTAVISYSDQSVVHLNSFEEFMTYNEVRSIRTNAIHIILIYLVKFQDKTVPEKQEINISFIAGIGFTNTIDDDILFFSNDSGAILFKINHTARSWGADLEALLTNHLSNLLHPRNKFKDWVKKYSDQISIISVIILFVTTIFGSIYATHIYTQKTNLYIQNTLKKVPDKTDFLLLYLSQGGWAKHYYSVFVFLILSLVVSILLGIWMSLAADSKEISFILFTKEDERKQKIILRKREKKWMQFILSVIISIITGVVANYLFVAMSS